MTPLVSVVMSTYNRADILSEAVDSILNQTFDDFEFIIINDNSTDDTHEKLIRYKDSRIRLFNNKKNCGCTFNYHNAQNLACGKYVAHIDDDDISLPERFEKQVDFMESNLDIDLAGTFIETFGEQGKVRPSWVFYTEPETLDFMMNFYNPICHSSVMYRKSFVDKCGINYDITKKCAQDYDFYKQIIINNGKLANLSEVLVKYRMHSNRLTDINESQQIQIMNAEKIKYELLSRYLSKKQIENQNMLLEGFPFNSYKKENVITAVEILGSVINSENNEFQRVIEKVKTDIENDLFTF